MIFAVLGFWMWVAWCVWFALRYRPRSIRGQTVLITGAGSGIGRLMAIEFARKGAANIILWDRDEVGMSQTSDAVEAAAPTVTCTTQTVDLSQREAVYRAARQAGPVDILVNNAGMVNGKRLLDTSDEAIDKILTVNAICHIWILKAFLPAMLERGGGHVVSVASAAGLCGVPGLVDYCASKFAAVGISEALYLEIRRLGMCNRIQVTSVCPYYIDTGMFTGVKPTFPLLPLLKPDWVAKRIVLGVLRGEEWINMPWFVNVGYIAKILPVPWQAWLADKFGLLNDMDSFKGR